ncbi:MAG: class II aldolase/adducin family protein [Firmicutes bacterium]|nr:class II aldolase/adducin family protein [Bacillota bacterium]
MDEQRIREEIIRIVRAEYRNGMVNMFEGNVSARLGDRFFITPSQVAKEDMTPEMIIEIDAGGDIVSAMEGMKPSSERMMHLEVYRLRPEVMAVVHNHSVYATAFAMNGMPIETDRLTEANMIIGTVPLVPYGTPGTSRIYEHFSDYIGETKSLLLANHGLITYGKSLQLAYSYAEAIEKIAHTIAVSKLLCADPDESTAIPSDELAMLREMSQNH